MTLRLEYNFSNQHLEMIEEANGDVAVTDFNPVPLDPTGLGLTGDYIRMSVLNEDGSFIRSFYSNLSGADEEVIYTSAGDTTAGLTPNTAVIANPSGVDLGFDPYPIYAVDTVSLDKYCALTYTGYFSHTSTDADTYYVYQTYAALIYELYALYEATIDIYGCSGGDGIGGCITISACETTFIGIYSDVEEICFTLDLSGNGIIGSGDLSDAENDVTTYSMWTLQLQSSATVADILECATSAASTEYTQDWTTGDLEPQLRIYKDADGNFYVKPNEALELENINEGNYQLQFDFLHNPFYVLGEAASVDQKYYFYITEVSPSRKEVRVVTRNGENARIPTVNFETGVFTPPWDDQIDNVLFGHGFNFVLAISNARNIPITNYKIDKVSDPVNPSLILKLYSPLPTDVTRLANVTIEQEIFTTQVEDIWYKTETYFDPTYGLGVGQFGGLLGIDDV